MAGVKLVAELRARPDFRERIRRIVSGHLTEFLDQARQAVDALQVRAKKHATGVVSESELPVDEAFLDRVFQGQVSDYRQLVTASDFKWLAEIAKTKFMTSQNAEASHRKDAERLLANHVVLRYQNDSAWFDLHPAVKEVPGVQAAMKAVGVESPP